MPQDLGLPDRYTLTRRIANGGMASVWCAHDRVLDRKVAIKLLSERFADHEPAVLRFKREARAAARLSGHPNVVTIYDVGHTARAFIVMEHLAGGTVADALRIGEVTQSQAVRWLHEAAAALDYAHAEGVLHRDVKPANMLLGRGRVLRLGDFGIARVPAEDTLTGTGEVFGTASYLAPERALGHGATEASDRYSLAVAAFELLAGRRPFTAEHYAAQVRQHVDEQPPRASSFNPALPSAVDGVLGRGLAKRPAERWPSAQAFADAIEESLTARTPQPAMVVTRPRRRAPAVAALAAAAFGVGIAAGANHGGPSGKPRPAALAQHAVAHRPPARARPAAHAVRRRQAPATSSTTTTVHATPAAAATPPPTADTLEARGHALMARGEYPAAVDLLHKAVAAASPGSLTYAYALYDLGRSLRLAGDPKAAIPILWQRMQIPNQTGAVRGELQLALQQVGAQLNGQKHHGQHGHQGD